MRTRVIVVLSIVGASVCAGAQTTGPANPPLIIRSLVGKDLFTFYCAPCHRREGAGDGPVAPQLKTPAPDLRFLARRNHGEFPRRKVELFVTGEGGAQAHGTTAMPVWGPVFRGLDASDTLATVRIREVVQYIESIQKN